jgi:hypothetical protein
MSESPRLVHRLEAPGSTGKHASLRVCKGGFRRRADVARGESILGLEEGNTRTFPTLPDGGDRRSTESAYDPDGVAEDGDVSEARQ